MPQKNHISVAMTVGQKVRVRCRAGRVWGTVLGWRYCDILLVDIAEEDADGYLFKEGTACDIQYLQEGVIYYFQTEVQDIWGLSQATKFLILQFPTHLKTRSLRKFPRIKIQIPAKVIDLANETWPCMILDISQGGCKLEIREAAFFIEDEIELFCFLPHQESHLQARCRVNGYYGDNCYGLEFEDLSAAQQNALDEFHVFMTTSETARDKSSMKEVLNADLGQISLLELLQILTKTGRDYQVDIVNGKNLGRMFLKEGEIVHVETDHLKGEEAIFNLFSLSQARCRVQRAGGIPGRNVKAKLNQLILEYVYRLDEKVIT